MKALQFTAVLYAVIFLSMSGNCDTLACTKCVIAAFVSRLMTWHACRQLSASSVHMAVCAAHSECCIACRKVILYLCSNAHNSCCVVQVYDTAAHSRIGKLDRPKSRSVLSWPGLPQTELNHRHKNSLLTSADSALLSCSHHCYQGPLACHMSNLLYTAAMLLHSSQIWLPATSFPSTLDSNKFPAAYAKV